MIIVASNAKGGVGKTTFIVTLACLWIDRKPVIVDTDGQSATENFMEFLPDVERFAVKASQAPDLLRELQGRLVLVDTPGDLETSMPVLKAANALIVPVQARYMAMRGSLQIIDTFREDLPDLPLKVLVTMLAPGAAFQRGIRDEIRDECGADAFASCINTNGAFDEASSVGKTIIDYAPDSLPAQQYMKVAKEAETWLQLPQVNPQA